MFSGVAGQLRSYLTSTATIVEGDVNGDRIADFSIALSGRVTLTSTTFDL